MPADSSEIAYDAIILAGGAGKRLGGNDKALVAVGGQTLLDRALEAVEQASRVIVVGPPRETASAVIFTSEEPAGGGPAAAIAHAAHVVQAKVVVVLAVDVPFASAAVPRLLAALPGHDAAMVLDGEGSRQPLIAAYRADVLKTRAGEADWANRSVRAFVEPFTVAEVIAEAHEALDCDTPDDVIVANQAARQLGSGSSGAVSS
jgi:molybdopterin-guanine dinucleotide biosynthesis protein A